MKPSLAANNTSGPQTIAFAIPTSEFWLVTGVALLELEEGPYSLIDSGTTIDFSTQTANIGDTNPTAPKLASTASSLTDGARPPFL